MRFMNALWKRIALRRSASTLSTPASPTVVVETGSEAKQSRITLNPVSHVIGNGGIAADIESMVKADAGVVLIEGSLYLGGFLPKGIDRSKVHVIWEPADLFLRNSSDLAPLYIGGQSIPREAGGVRRLIESIAHQIDSRSEPINFGKLASQLLAIRSKYPDVVVYNEPEAWLRTAWYEADLLFHYLSSRESFRLFGALIYSDLDHTFVDFVRLTENALHAMTGSKCMLYSFDGRLSKASQLLLNSQYIAYKSATESIRFGNIDKPTAADLDSLKAQLATALTFPGDLNQSMLFAEKLGVEHSKTPCIAFWEDLSRQQILVFSFAGFSSDADQIGKVFKRLSDTINEELTLPDSDLLDRLAVRFKQEESRYSTDARVLGQTIGTITKDFLFEKRTTHIIVDNSTHIAHSTGVVVTNQTPIGDNNLLVSRGKGEIVKEQFNVQGSQVGAVGPNAHVHDSNFVQNTNSPQVNLDSLGPELATLREELQKLASERDQYAAIVAVADAETAVKSKDEKSAWRHLAHAGKWAFDVATKIGVSVAAEAIKSASGMK